MARFISPITDMKPNGSLRFFKSGTNTTLVTYKDELETPGLENPVIVPVLPNGNVQNVFYQGSAKVIYLDEFDQQYAERDPVGGEKELGAFTLWDTTVTYDLNDIVEGSDGNFYKSLSNSNTSNDPTTTPVEWEEIRFIGMWNINVVYAIGEVVQTSNGNLWAAQTATAGNDPSTDDSTNWLPAIDSNITADITNLKKRTGISGASTTPVGFDYFATANATVTMDDVTGFIGGERFSIVAAKGVIGSTLTVDGSNGELIEPASGGATDTVFNLTTVGVNFEFIFNAVTGNWEV